MNELPKSVRDELARQQHAGSSHPDTDLLTAFSEGTATASERATIEQHDQGVRGFVIDALTPETSSSTHYFWGMARNFDIRDAGFTARFQHIHPPPTTTSSR